ncbi:MAG TPA: protein kinase [Trebonia sp.]|jgi:serine/threonine-protein kinase|nr:protein kinase [Trebonia sp.]
MTAWTVPSYAEWSVPGYTEEWPLGHGVSGRVVAAVNDATGQHVAIKYLHGNLVRDTEFLGELRSAAERQVSLNAPHMVRVFDYVEQPGEGAAIVMELVDGVSLREMLRRRGPLGAAAALVVLKDLLLALAAAHSHRIPHRDVKPDNVLIDARGWCTLTDFGVAVKTDKQMRAPGTPEYMAPELWQGAPSVPATDIYAATAVLCESLTGKPPFSGRVGRLRLHHESTPVPLDEFDPPLQDLIASGLAKDPAARPSRALSFVSDLEAQATAAYGPSWEDEGRRELAEREAELLPLLEGGAGGGSARVTRLARRKTLAFVSVAVVALVALVAAGAVVLSKSSGGQVQLSSVSASSVDAQISVTPPVAVSKCKTPTTFTFTGSISDGQPGPLSYQWLYSSGKQGPVQTLNFTAAGQQQVGGGAVTTSTAGEGWAQLKLLLNPGSTTSDKATYQLLCSTANSDIAVSATVKPAAQNFASCSAPQPTLTAGGTITSKSAGTVSYYWAMSDGERTKPDAATFASAGTQAADPLTFPAWVPTTGSVVLVVTSPAVVASKPAAYKVTCGLPATTATPGAPAQATLPAAATSSAKSSASPRASTVAPTSAKTSPAPAPTTSSPTPAPATSSPAPAPSPTTATPVPTLTIIATLPPPTTLPATPTP